jgi:hypothetical protein
MPNAAYTPTQTRFLVDTGGEVMTARFVEVRDDYPMPASEQIISLGRAAISWVCEEVRSRPGATDDRPPAIAFIYIVKELLIDLVL